MQFKKVYPRSLNEDGRGTFANLSMFVFGLGFLATLGWGIWLTVTAHSLLFSLSVFGMAATALSTFLVSLFVTGDQNEFRTRHPYWSMLFAISTIILTVVTMVALMTLGAPTGGAFFGALAVGGVNGYAWFQSGKSADQFNTGFVHTDQQRGVDGELCRIIEERNRLEGRRDYQATFNQYNECVDRFPGMEKEVVLKTLRAELEAQQKADKQRLEETIGHFAPHEPNTASTDTDNVNESLLRRDSQSDSSSLTASSGTEGTRKRGMHPGGNPDDGL